MSLDYNGTPMRPEPANMTMALVIGQLRQGNPVIVKLEPGDATHYCLLIVPAWADNVFQHLGRYGIRENTARHYMIVTKLDDAGGESFFSFDEGNMEADMRHIKNGWTRELLAWWFSLLWAQLRPQPVEAL